MKIEYQSDHWAEVHYAHMWRDAGAADNYDTDFVDNEGNVMYYKAYKGADQELTDLTTFNEYGWKYYLEKYLKNDDDPVKYFRPNENIGTNGVYLESIKDIDQVRRTAFPTRYYGKTSDDYKQRRYFGSIIAGDQKIYMLEVPANIQVVTLTNANTKWEKYRDPMTGDYISREAREYDPIVKITFDKGSSSDEFSHSKILWIVLTFKSDSRFDIEISRLAFDSSENPYRNLRRYLFSKDENAPIEVVQEKGGRVYDISSGTLLGNKKLIGYSYPLINSRNIEDTWSSLISYKKGERVLYYSKDEKKDALFISQVSNNCGNIPGLSPYWVREGSIITDDIINVSYRRVDDLTANNLNLISPNKVSIINTRKNNNVFSVNLKPIDGYLPTGHIRNILGTSLTTKDTSKNTNYVQYVSNYSPIDDSNFSNYLRDITESWVSYYYKKNVLNDEVEDYIPYNFSINNYDFDHSGIGIELGPVQGFLVEFKLTKNNITSNIKRMTVTIDEEDSGFESGRIELEGNLLVKEIRRYHNGLDSTLPLQDRKVKDIIEYETRYNSSMDVTSVSFIDDYDVPGGYTYEIVCTEVLLAVSAKVENNNFMTLSSNSIYFEKKESKNILFRFNDNLSFDNNVKILLDKNESAGEDTPQLMSLMSLSDESQDIPGENGEYGGNNDVSSGTDEAWKTFNLDGNTRDLLQNAASLGEALSILGVEDTEDMFKVDLNYIPDTTNGRSSSGSGYYSISTELLSAEVVDKIRNLNITFKKE